MDVVLLALYSIAATGLGLYGLNYFVTVWLWRKSKPAHPPLPVFATCPRVTVQLPIYNERYVVERLIDACATLDYPRDRLQIQVLDDSDDATTPIAHARVEHHQRRGVDIQLVRRTHRGGYKAGALAHALPAARGEFIAIFDADFVPTPDFLKQTIPHLVAEPGLGMAQTRWSHLNADYSALTRAQAIALDGHFVIEQAARAANQLFLNFNGSGGVWRRACIEDAGGWHADTLSEDLDLSYRAQMRGWKFLFLPDVTAPAEIPPQIHAFKRQQFRWAKGSTQCLLKLGPRLARACGTPPLKRAQGLLHLSGYLMNPLMLLVVLTLMPLLALGLRPPEPLMYFSLVTLGPTTLYAVSQRALYRDWRARFAYFAVLLLLGIGIAWNNSLAVLAAITGRQNTFRRTPKFRVERDDDAWATKEYALSFGWEALGELGLALYAGVGALIAWQQNLVWALPYLLLYAAGFGYTGLLSLAHSVASRKPPIPSDRRPATCDLSPATGD